MNSIVGFTISSGLSEVKAKAAATAQSRALDQFQHLNELSIHVGQSRIDFWGHKDFGQRIHHQQDGAILALIGSPCGEIFWPEIEVSLTYDTGPDAFELPWDGRYVLLKVSADGKRWSMWNDWLGSIPVFHHMNKQERVVGTLEPVVVAASGFSSKDIFLPGLVSMMINGHFFSDWTLFNDMYVVPPDSVSVWDEDGFSSNQLWTVMPSEDRWESSWDDLIDEMYVLSHQAISDVLSSRPSWIIPLSSGLDSRLIAAVAADTGNEVHTFAWGPSDSTDVIYSKQIAETLGLPWKHITLPADFLIKYTRQWADLYGSALHFHGMYLMSFLDALEAEPDGSVMIGLIGDTLAGDIVSELDSYHALNGRSQLENEWYVHWNSDELRSLMKTSIDDAIDANVLEIKKQLESYPGSRFQKLQYLELWGRQRLFIPFQSVLCDYWRGVGTPFLNREYARFCLSLPRVALDNRRLLADVYRRYYGYIATIPGTYANDPFIMTGRYLLKHRISKVLPQSLLRGPLIAFRPSPLRMDLACVQASGRAALWPVDEAYDQLGERFDLNQIETEYQSVLLSTEDIRPQKKLQAVQAIAYRLLDS